MYDSIDNMWSLLFATGYLTQDGNPTGNLVRLMIPNAEVRSIFSELFFDMAIEIEDESIGIVIEVKYAENEDYDAACAQALEQIHKNEYTAMLKEDDMQTILKYGIACYKKKCRVVLEREM